MSMEQLAEPVGKTLNACGVGTVFACFFQSPDLVVNICAIVGAICAIAGLRIQYLSYKRNKDE